MIEIYHEDELKDYLYTKMNNGRYFNFNFICEEQEIACDRRKKQWDLIGHDGISYYLIELKTNSIDDVELEYMNYVAQRFKSFKNIKVVLISPKWTIKNKNKVAKYRDIIYSELDWIKYKEKMSYLSSYRQIKYPNDDYIFDAISKFSYLDTENFKYYTGYSTIDKKYIILSFKFRDKLGIMIKYTNKSPKDKKYSINGFLSYQILYYETSYYYEVISTYSYIPQYKLNDLFEIFKNLDDNLYRGYTISKLQSSIKNLENDKKNSYYKNYYNFKGRD